VASSIPSTAAQIAGVSPSASPTAVQAPLDGDAAAGADFGSVISQLLGANSAEAVLEQADEVPEIAGEAAAAMAGDESPAQMFASALPVIAEITQAMRNTPNTTGTETNLPASVAAAIAAGAQRPAMASEIAAGTQQRSAAEAQGTLSQAQLQSALVGGSSANAFSSARDSHDNSANKQDGGPASMAGSAMTIGGQSQAEAPRAELQIGSRVGSHVWRDEVAAKLTWMIDRGIQHGTLRLSPENLGPLEVRITTQNDQVSVWFGAAHADTRAALENALPRLREMFAAQGMSLADAGVFREPPKDTPNGYTASHGGAIEGVEERSFAVSVRDGLLDAYA